MLEQNTAVGTSAKEARDSADVAQDRTVAIQDLLRAAKAVYDQGSAYHLLAAALQAQIAAVVLLQAGAEMSDLVPLNRLIVDLGALGGGHRPEMLRPPAGNKRGGKPTTLDMLTRRGCAAVAMEFLLLEPGHEGGSEAAAKWVSRRIVKWRRMSPVSTKAPLWEQVKNWWEQASDPHSDHSDALVYRAHIKAQKETGVPLRQAAEQALAAGLIFG